MFQNTNILFYIIILVLISLLYPSVQQQWVPHIVWIYQQQQQIKQQQTYKHIVKTIKNNNKQMLNRNNDDNFIWQIRYINQNNIANWIKLIPKDQTKYNNILQTESYINNINKFRYNIILLELVKYYGGVWIDNKIILTNNIQWLFRLQEQQNIFNGNNNKEMNGNNKPQVFMLFKSQHKDIKTQIQLSFQQSVFQTFFIAAEAKSKFFTQCYQLYIQSHSKQKYSNNKQSPLINLAKQFHVQLGQLQYQAQQKQLQILMKIIIQRKQTQLNIQDKDTHSKLLALNYYSIWSFYSDSTAYLLHKFHQQTHKQQKLLYLLTQTDINYLRINNAFPTYFIKLTNENINTLKQYFLTGFIITTYFIKCQQSYHILHNSIIYKYLLQKYQIKFYNNQVVDISYSRNCITPNQLFNYHQKYKSKIYQLKKSIMKILFSIFILITVLIMRYRKHGQYIKMQQNKIKIEQNQNYIEKEKNSKVYLSQLS